MESSSSSPLSWPLRLLAQIISIFFHPVFIPVYLMLFLLFEHPYQYLGFSSGKKFIVLLQSISMYTFFPLVTVALLRALRFISSFQLSDRKDRIIPLVACGIWYFWIWYIWHNLDSISAASVQLALGVWLTATLGLLLNIYLKISLHLLSMGVALCFMVLLSLQESLHYGTWLSVVFIATGLVCSARLAISDHRPVEVYGGLAAGALCMLVAWMVE